MEDNSSLENVCMGAEVVDRRNIDTILNSSVVVN